MPPQIAAPHLIPVPLAAARLRERGYNQAAGLSSRVIAASGGLPLDAGLLRTRHPATGWAEPRRAARVC
ncbi:MAG: hypothetical protein U0232_25480 [Thermomicrobiales bacterium]